MYFHVLHEDGDHLDAKKLEFRYPFFPFGFKYNIIPI